MRAGSAMAVLLLACGAVAQVSDTLSLTLARTEKDSGLGLNLDLDMYVVEVDAPSAASQAGVQVGMRLTSIDGELYLDRLDALATLNEPGEYALNMHLACLRYTEKVACGGDCSWDHDHSRCAPKSLFPGRINPPTGSPSGRPTTLISPSAQQHQFQVVRASATDSTGFSADGAQVVNEVTSGSPAAAAGLLNGMRVVRVNGQAVNGMLELQAALMQAPASFSLTVLAHCTTFRSAALCNAAREAPEFAPGCFWVGTECMGYNGQSTAAPEVIGLMPSTPQVQSSDNLIGGMPVGGFVGLVVGVVVFLIVAVVLVWYFCFRPDDGIKYREGCDTSDVYEVYEGDQEYDGENVESLFEDSEVYGSDMESEATTKTPKTGDMISESQPSYGGSPESRDRFGSVQRGRYTHRDAPAETAGSETNYGSPHSGDPRGFGGPRPSPSYSYKPSDAPRRQSFPPSPQPQSMYKAESFVSHQSGRHSHRAHGARGSKSRTDSMVAASQYEMNMSRSRSARFSGYAAPPVATWAK